MATEERQPPTPPPGEAAKYRSWLDKQPQRQDARDTASSKNGKAEGELAARVPKQEGGAGDKGRWEKPNPLKEWEKPNPPKEWENPTALKPKDNILLPDGTIAEVAWVNPKVGIALKKPDGTIAVENMPTDTSTRVSEWFAAAHAGLKTSDGKPDTEAQKLKLEEGKKLADENKARLAEIAKLDLKWIHADTIQQEAKDAPLAMTWSDVDKAKSGDAWNIAKAIVSSDKKYEDKKDEKNQMSPEEQKRSADYQARLSDTTSKESLKDRVETMKREEQQADKKEAIAAQEKAITADVTKLASNPKIPDGDKPGTTASYQKWIEALRNPNTTTEQRTKIQNAMSAEIWNTVLSNGGRKLEVIGHKDGSVILKGERDPDTGAPATPLTIPYADFNISKTADGKPLSDAHKDTFWSIEAPKTDVKPDPTKVTAAPTVTPNAPAAAPTPAKSPVENKPSAPAAAEPVVEKPAAAPTVAKTAEGKIADKIPQGTFTEAGDYKVLSGTAWGGKKVAIEGNTIKFGGTLPKSKGEFITDNAGYIRLDDNGKIDGSGDFSEPMDKMDAKTQRIIVEELKKMWININT